MDNDNKIAMKTESNHKAEVRLFLKEELRPLERSKEVQYSYNLGSEYGKTRKNRNYFVWLLLTGCIALVVLITYVVVQHLSVQNQKIEIEENVFSDLDMRSLLNTRSNLEMKYLIATNDLNQLEIDRDFKLKQAAFKRDNSLQLISALRAENLEELRNRAVVVYNNDVKAVHEEFDEAIASKKSEVDGYKLNLDKIDSQQIDMADFTSQVQQHERSAIVTSFNDSVAAMQETMKNAQQQDYINQRNDVTQLAKKYHTEVDALDPVLKNEQADLIVKEADSIILENLSLYDYMNSLPKRVLTTDFKSSLQRIALLISDYNYIHSEIDNIPQKNSIKEYKSSENKLILGALTEVSTAVHSLVTQLYKNIVSLEDNVAQLRAQKASLETDNKSLTEQLSDITNKNTILQSEYDGISGNVTMFNAWFEQLATDEESVGYVLGTSLATATPSQIQVFIVESLRTRFASTNAEIPVEIYRGKRKKIADGNLYSQEGSYFFRLDATKTSSAIEGGDRIVLVQ